MYRSFHASRENSTDLPAFSPDLRDVIHSQFKENRALPFEAVQRAILVTIFQVWQLATRSGHHSLDENTSSLVEINQAQQTVRRSLEPVLEEKGSVELTAAFEYVLSLTGDYAGRARLVQHSTRALNDLLSQVVPARSSILDPACGFGETLLAIPKAENAQITAIEIFSEVADIVKMRFLMHGETKVQVRNENSLAIDTSKQVELIVTEPPISQRLRSDEVSKRLHDSVGARGSIDGNAAWMRYVLEHLKPDGLGFVVTSRSVASGRGQAHTVISEAIQSNRINSLIALPPGFLSGTKVPSMLLVFGSARPEGVLLCNAVDLELNQREFHSSVPSIQLLKNWIRGEETPDLPGWHAKVVSRNELLEDGIAISSHLSPPPTEEAIRPEPKGTFLTGISLENFKSIEALNHIPLRPLTLIYGKNSAGKSSLMQSLLLLRQSVLRNALTVAGDLIDLGSFAGLVHGHNDEKSIQIGVTFASHRAIDSERILPNPELERSVMLKFSTESVKQGGMPLSVTTSIAGHGIELHKGNSEERTLSLALSTLDEAISTVFTADASFPSHEKRPMGRVRGIVNQFRKLGIEEIPMSMENLNIHTPHPDFLAQLDYTLESRGMGFGLERRTLIRMAESFAAIGDELKNLLSRIVYLGPLRQSPSRFSRRQQSGTMADLPFVLLENSTERAEVSKWLRRLGTPYELDVVNPIQPDYRKTIGDIASILLRDVRSGIQISPADVGFGISQVLPIVTELSARANSIILIEQPEIHLHPAMQAEVADLLIESSERDGRGNQIIVETHSETLVLRLQRRIKEQTLSADDVLVLYVDQTPDGAGTIQQLRLDESGEFIDPWPGGFFDEQFTELFGDL